MLSTYLSLRPRPQPPRNPFHIVAGRPSPQRAGHFLKRTACQGTLRPLHPRLESTDLKLPSLDIRGDIQLSGRRERCVGRLNREGTSIERFGAFAGRCCTRLWPRKGGLAL